MKTKTLLNFFHVISYYWETHTFPSAVINDTITVSITMIIVSIFIVNLYYYRYYIYMYTLQLLLTIDYSIIRYMRKMFFLLKIIVVLWKDRKMKDIFFYNLFRQELRFFNSVPFSICGLEKANFICDLLLYIK